MITMGRKGMSNSAGPGLHVVLRSHGGENQKSRPSFYDKLSCLASLVRAVEELGDAAEIVFVNDGPIPEMRSDLMVSAGEVLRLEAGSNRTCYRETVNLVHRRGLPGGDVIWFAEDDYLYAPDSFVRLMAAVEALPGADYFSLHSPYALDDRGGRRRPRARHQLGADGDPAAVRLGETRWFRGLSTTSTFGVRARCLRQDRHILRSAPFTGGAWDHTTCLMVQGLQPFSGRELREDLVPLGETPVVEWPRHIVRGSVRALMSPLALRPASRRRVLMTSDPAPIAHLEDGAFDDHETWAQLACDSRVWADERMAHVRRPNAGSVAG